MSTKGECVRSDMLAPARPVFLFNKEDKNDN